MKEMHRTKNGGEGTQSFYFLSWYHLPSTAVCSVVQKLLKPHLGVYMAMVD